MRIAAGWDHRGRTFADELQRRIEDMGHEFVSMGAETDEPSDYTDFAIRVAEAVSRGECDRGILLCGTGNGMAMAANKVAGIRCAVVWNESSARYAREHNDANMVSIGQRLVALDVAKCAVDVWLGSAFAGGRHARRVRQIASVEESWCDQ